MSIAIADAVRCRKEEPGRSSGFRWTSSRKWRSGWWWWLTNDGSRTCENVVAGPKSEVMQEHRRPSPRPPSNPAIISYKSRTRSCGEWQALLPEAWPGRRSPGVDVGPSPRSRLSTFRRRRPRASTCRRGPASSVSAQRHLRREAPGGDGRQRAATGGNGRRQREEATGGDGRWREVLGGEGPRGEATGDDRRRRETTGDDGRRREARNPTGTRTRTASSLCPGKGSAGTRESDGEDSQLATSVTPATAEVGPRDI
jgi:hypothetical protein